MVNIGKHTVAGQSLAGILAAVLVLVLAPVGDAMGQAGRHGAVCDHCGNAGAVVKVADSSAVETIPQDILEQIRAAALAGNAEAVQEASWVYSLDGLMLEFAKTGNVAGIRTLLAAGADVDAADASGFTPLHVAAAQGHADAVKALLAAGADIEAVTDKGHTPLHAAAWVGQVDVVAALLAAGAYPEAETEGGVTPLHAARANKHYKIANMLKRAGARR